MLAFGNNGNEKAIERNVTIVTPQEAFLAAFSLHPAGVAVITGRLDDGTPAGFTATSLASFSADPPRATVNIAQHASSYPAVALGKTVLLHFLSGDQVGVARTMAADFSERFNGDHWAPGMGGLPQLRGVRGVLHATVVAVTEVGDNATIVFDIIDGETHPTNAPLVYVDRRYHGVGDVVAD
jgi:flavin reductase (DIM6/NTAB) family NADH-FMN oxidoreductase RutF